MARVLEFVAVVGLGDEVAKQLREVVVEPSRVALVHSLA
jgi:hypothetical protein